MSDPIEPTPSPAGQPGRERRRVEVVALRDPDGPLTLTFFLDGREARADALGVAVYVVDEGAMSGEDWWPGAMERLAAEASPGAGELIREALHHSGPGASDEVAEWMAAYAEELAEGQEG